MVIEGVVREAYSDAMVAKIRSGFYIKGVSGFGHRGNAKVIEEGIPTVPDRAPDFIGTEKTQSNQAFLYRLCNDRNPLHADPSASAKGGFDVPILHGLCTFGFTARSLQEEFFPQNA